MLVKATVEEINKYGELAYRLAVNPAKACYPFYGDGVKTKAEFLNAAERAVLKKNSEVLLFSLDGHIEGWLSYYWIPEDTYLQLDGFNINRGAEKALTELVDMIETDFPGYTAYFGFPGDNGEAIRFLAEHGFQCIEQDWNHAFSFDGYAPKACSPCVERITRQNFDKFRAVYHADSETYWNPDRIFKAMDDWTVFVYSRADIPAAAVYLTGADGYFEIFGVEFADGVLEENAFCALLTASLSACKAMGAKYLTYFCGEKEKGILSELGFRCVGEYVLLCKYV